MYTKPGECCRHKSRTPRFVFRYTAHSKLTVSNTFAFLVSLPMPLTCARNRESFRLVQKYYSSNNRRFLAALVDIWSMASPLTIAETELVLTPRIPFLFNHGALEHWRHSIGCDLTECKYLLRRIGAYCRTQTALLIVPFFHFCFAAALFLSSL